MCAYCNLGDHQFRFDPPWRKDDLPQLPQSVPQPLAPYRQISPWDVERLREYLGLLKEVKALEDALGCPCEPNKADYIGLFEKRIATLEGRASKLRNAVKAKRSRPSK